MQTALSMLSQYTCPCGHQFELIVDSIEQRERISCPQCSSTLSTGLREQVISFYPAGEPGTRVNFRVG